MAFISENFRQSILTMHRKEGQEWLERLPAILSQCEERWELRIGKAFSGLSQHYVSSGIRRSGETCVLKVHAPSGEFGEEAEALRLFAGKGMVQLLDIDKENRVLLLEYLSPGRELVELKDDEEATRIAAGVMKRIWRPAPEQSDFPRVEDWGRGFTRLRQYYNGGAGPFPAKLLDEAERLFSELNASAAEAVFLHGDLHHYNILQAEREPWLAIDPKGLIGEPGYEVGALLRNPLDLLQKPHPERLLTRRVAILAEELGIEAERVRGWGIAQAVLACWWGVEDTGKLWQHALNCAELLSDSF